MNDKTLTRTDKARAIFDRELGSIRKPRGKLKFVNADLENKIVTAFVDEAGYANERGAKTALTRIMNEAAEAGEITLDAPPEPEPKGPKMIDLARQAVAAGINRLLTTDISYTDWRRAMIESIMKACECNVDTAAAQFNTCLKENVEAGLIPESRVGRDAEPIDLSKPWAVVNPVGLPINSHSTRKAAMAAASANQTVGKTADLVPNG